ncbi:hypothetical protein OAS39_09035 [Pirellulales bacterium]|nr:hypothetical protein [Pirellulales bacterium]
MRTLANAGYLVMESRLAREELNLTAPTITFSPGDELPDFGAAAWKFTTRSKHLGAIPTDIIWATRRTKEELDGPIGGRPPRQSEISHDIGVARILLHYLEHKPEHAAHWQHEDHLRQLYGNTIERGELPDAVIRPEPNGPPILAIEQAGSGYRDYKLVKWHQANCNTNYEIW